MAFDCVFVDFGENNASKHVIQKEFPHAVTTPFVESYFKILKSFVSCIKTEYFWLVTDIVNLQNFDFDFIPEQHQRDQIHVWNGNHQTEGDIMLVPTQKFKDQMSHIKYLRDFKDINYHKDDLLTFNCWPSHPFTCDDLIQQVKSQKTRYVNYYHKEIKNVTPSFWEDEKLYVVGENKLNLLVPRFSVKEELYEYTPRIMIDGTKDTVHYDVCFIHNGEPQAEHNLALLRSALKNKPNKLHIISNVKGRRQAYQAAANKSQTEFFYAVFAKLEIDKDFGFDFMPDTLKSPRHYIFDCYNSEIDYAYGHQAVILYNRKMVLENKGNKLDFTLAQKHDHVPLLSARTTFHHDDKVYYRTTFREVVKLIYFLKKKPTVESNFILKKWFDSENPVVSRAAADAKKFVEQNNYDFKEIFKTYEWDFVDELFLKGLV